MSAPVAGAVLDHVHLCVRDRAKAQEWYRAILDLRLLGPGYGDVADEHPVFLAPAATPTEHYLSLFVGTPANGGDRNIAFRVAAAAFADFLEGLLTSLVIAQKGGPLGPNHVNDYGLAMTLNFLDLDGNELELVTYQTDALREALA